jgi:hypothetical protein
MNLVRVQDVLLQSFSASLTVTGTVMLHRFLGELCVLSNFELYVDDS